MIWLPQLIKPDRVHYSHFVFGVAALVHQIKHSPFTCKLYGQSLLSASRTAAFYNNCLQTAKVMTKCGSPFDFVACLMYRYVFKLTLTANDFRFLY